MDISEQVRNTLKMGFRKYLTIALISIFLTGSTSQSIAQSLYSGTLLVENWSCFAKPEKTESMGPTKVAELNFSPVVQSKRGTSTRISFTSLQLRATSKSWKSIALNVEYQGKSLKRSVISLKNTEEFQPITFSVDLPLNLLDKADFRPMLQGAKGVQESPAGCLTEEIYEKTFPIVDMPTKVEKDPVLNKIKSRLSSLESNIENSETREIIWIVSPNVPSSYKIALESQSDALAKAYPNLYKWNQPVTFVLGDVLSWTPSATSISPACMRFVLQMKTFWKKQGHLDNRILAGTSYCDEHMIVVMRPNPSKTEPDSDIMGQEVGGVIQENAFLNNPILATLQRDQIRIPYWYEQGSQSIFGFVAYLAKNGKIDGAPNKAIVSPECKSISLKDIELSPNGAMQLSNCPYTKGFAAVRLMIALYGWDAATSWYAGFTTATDYEDAFEKIYGDSLSEFEKWADSYWKFLVDPKKTPATLIARLAKA
ncbi:unannotated protein [freshwater metagenome]|uniref:Unannotated protein n=2 Tax=freshwater metagenome TaxID=449393 RepID=A0A6J6B2H4_9ZZZZ